MSLFHSTAANTNSVQSQSLTVNTAAEGVTPTPTSEMDYLASAFAANGVFPYYQNNHQNSCQAATITSVEMMNALIVAAGASNPIDPFTASTLLSSLMYGSQQAESISHTSSNRQQTYSTTKMPNEQSSTTSATTTTAALLSQRNQMQEEVERQIQLQTASQQHQMALAVAATLLGGGSGTQENLLSGSYKSDENPANNSNPTTTDESFSAVFAKLAQGLNQSSCNNNTINNSSAVTVASDFNKIQHDGSINNKTQHTSMTINQVDLNASYQAAAAAAATASFLSAAGLGPGFVGSNDSNSSSLAVASFAAATVAALHQQTQVQQQQQFQHQNRQQNSYHHEKQPSKNKCVSINQTANQHPHRGRGRPPKSSIHNSQPKTDKFMALPAPIPPPNPSTLSTMTNCEASVDAPLVYATSNSIDGTITDVLRSHLETPEQAVNSGGGRKRRRVEDDGIRQQQQMLTTESSPSASSSPSPATSSIATTPTTCSAAGQKRSRNAGTYTDSGYRLPLALGWRRESLVKGVGPGGLLGEVVYIAPCGRQLWNYESVREYLRSNNINILTTEDFTFKSYVRLGDYYECHKEAKGFVKMPEAAVDTLIATALDSSNSTTSRQNSWNTNPFCQPKSSTSSILTQPPISNCNNAGATLTGFPYVDGNSDSFVLPSPLSQSITSTSSRFVAPTLNLPNHLMGSLWAPWQFSTSPTPPIISQLPTTNLFLQQQLQLQQHQMLGMPNLNSLEDAEKLKDFFIRLVDDQHRLEEEREIQRKAHQEAQLIKMREQRIEQLIKMEMKRPVEDLCLLNQKELPELEAIEGNKMSSEMFANCLLVIEFLHAFTEILCIDSETIPSIGCLQAALIDRDEGCLKAVTHVITELLKFAILDPGIPSPRLVTQLLGQRFSEMEVNSETTTGLLRVFLIGRNGYEDDMSDWLAPGNCEHVSQLPGYQLARLLAFVCDELVCSSRLISTEVDRTIELQAALRRDKFTLETKIRRIRVLLARKFGQDANLQSPSFYDSNMVTSNSLDDCAKSNHDGDEEYQKIRESLLLPSKLEAANSRQPSLLMNSSQGGATAVVMAAKTSYYISGDDEMELETSEELERRITALDQVVEAKQQAIDECSYRLSGLYLGQDRFSRNYFVLGSVGGVYIEENSSLSPFDPNVIVSQIKARRELAATRHYNCTNTSKSTMRREAPLTKLELPDVKSTILINDSERKDHKTKEDEPKEQLAKLEEPNIQNEISISELNEESKIESSTVNKNEENESEFKKGYDNDNSFDENLTSVTFSSDSNQGSADEIIVEEKVEEKSDVELKYSGKNKDKYILVKETDELTEELEKKENFEEKEEIVEENVVEEKQVEDRSSPQPLDLSNKPRLENIVKHPETADSVEETTAPTNLITLWQSLTEHELATALESANLDDTFLTTAALLFVTQTGILDRSSIGIGAGIGIWNQGGDSNWHVIVLFYKLQLLRVVAFENKTGTSTLSTALQQLKRWLNDGESVSTKNIIDEDSCEDKYENEELLPTIDKILEERGVQRPWVVEKETVAYPEGWWRVDSLEKLESLISALSTRGIRERMLIQSIKHEEETVGPSVLVDASTVLNINKISAALIDGWKPNLLRVRSRRGKGRGYTLPFYSSPSVSNLTNFTPVSSINTNNSQAVNCSLHSCNSTTELVASTELSCSDVSPYSLRPSRESSEALTVNFPSASISVDESSPLVIDKSVFLGDNYNRTMSLGSEGVNSEFITECRFLELAESLVDRVLSASLQTKGWQAPIKAMDDDSIQLIPRTTPKRSRFEQWPLDVARDRLLDLEAHLERRYLLPPLNCESHLDLVEEERDSGDLSVGVVEGNSMCSDSNESSDIAIPHIRRVIKPSSYDTPPPPSSAPGPVAANGTYSSTLQSGSPLPLAALLEWRQNIAKATSIDQLKKYASQLETAVAWDKSIMKVLCQICRRDKNEARLLLCDGCDHGYHTYCFRPPLTSIPTGDWFCFNCISMATGKRHCFVCGSTRASHPSTAPATALNSFNGSSPPISSPIVEPAHRLAQCNTCSRGAHPACLRPPASRLPRRWNCQFCIATGITKISTVVPPVIVPDLANDSLICDANKNDLDKNMKKEKTGRVRLMNNMKRPHTKAALRAVEKSQKVLDVVEKRGRKPKNTLSMYMRKKKKQIMLAKNNKIKSSKRRGRPPSGSYKVVEEIDKDMESKVGSEITPEPASILQSLANGDEALTSRSYSPKHQQEPQIAQVPMSKIDQEYCLRATEDLLQHKSSWPFRKPVCCKSVPIYKKVIKRPMDLSTILKRISGDKWNTDISIQEWLVDVRLIFKNCEIFNEDDSDIGRAGHTMREYFESKWASNLFPSLNYQEKVMAEKAISPERVENSSSSPMTSSPNPHSLAMHPPGTPERDMSLDVSSGRVHDISETTQPASDSRVVGSRPDDSRIEEKDMEVDDDEAEEDDDGDDMPTSPARGLSSSTMESMIGA